MSISHWGMFPVIYWPVMEGGKIVWRDVNEERPAILGYKPA